MHIATALLNATKTLEYKKESLTRLIRVRLEFYVVGMTHDAFLFRK